MINHLAVLMLGAEHDNLGIHIHPDIVTWRPIEEFAGTDAFLLSCRVGGRELPLKHIAPVGTLAEISLKSLEERRRVDAGRERKYSPLIFP